MLLQRLRELEARAPKGPDESAELPPEYTLRSIPWIVELDARGKLAGVVRTTGGRGRVDPGKPLRVPQLRRSGTRIKPQLLADTAEFVLGVPSEDVPNRAASRHREFVALVRACALHTGEPLAKAVETFLGSGLLEPIDVPSDLKPGDWVTFRVEGTLPVDLSSVRSFWANVAPRLGDKGLPDLTPDLVLSWLDGDTERTVGQCLVCGELRPIARVHPVPVRLPRAVADQQLAIVTANKDAFWSYGLEQSFLSPTCRPCAESYARAINRLVQDERHHVLVGSAVFVFWTRQDVPFDLRTFLDAPRPEQVRLLMESLDAGRSIPNLDETRFYATALTSSGGRAVVRDWIDTTVGDVKTHLRKWFLLHQVVTPNGDEPQPLPLSRLAKAIVRNPAKDLPPPPVSRALLRVALVGGRLPVDVLCRAIQRNRLERAVTRERAALIKLALLSHWSDNEEESMVRLEPDNPSPAYRCGRLLAVLAEIQREAIGKARLVDRFFGTASSAPAAVFPSLLRGARYHLAKVERDRPNVCHALEQRLQEVVANLDSFPRILTLEQQGLFSLGYYHQRAEDWRQMRVATERRKAALAEAAASEGPETTTEERN